MLEVGTGSGVVIAFLNANAETIFGRRVLTLGVDVNVDACLGTRETVAAAVGEATKGTSTDGDGSTNGTDGSTSGAGLYLGSLNSDLTSLLVANLVDVLVFNPPYVPTETLPELPISSQLASSATKLPGPTTTEHPTLEDATLLPAHAQQALRAQAAQARHERESHLLALSYAGGVDGMESTNRLLAQIPEVLSRRGVAYVLLCARNKPEEVRRRVLGWNNMSREGGSDDRNGTGVEQWRAEVVSESGGKGGWERLVILRIWREYEDESKP